MDMTEDRGRTIGSRLLRRHSSLTDLGPGLRKKSSRPPGALLRRTSSFGGGPIVVVPVQSLPPETEPPHLRWLILLLACLLLFGNYYAYDNPAALNRPLQAFLGHDYDTWQYELNLMYAVYSFPNMFIPLIGGSLMDKADPAWVLLGFSTVVCLGQSLFALGVTLKSFSLMLLGRILFGIGGESISVAQASITTSWFKGKELAFALGLNLCIARLGSVANSIMSPRIERKFSVPVAVWVGTLTCCMSLCCALVLSGIIRTRMKLRNAREEESRGNNSEDEVEEPQTRSLLHPLRKETSAADLDEANMETQPLIDNTYQVDTSERDTSPTSSTSEISGSWADFTLLPLSFWIVCLICVLLYGTVVPFNNIASDFLMSKWYPGDTQTAGAVMSIPDSMSAVLVPFCGVLVDMYGGRASFLVLCSLLIMGAHLTLGLTMINPVIPLVFLGLSYSMYGVAIWPSIATLVEHQEGLLAKTMARPPKLVGTAFGVSTSVLNTALTIFPIIAAGIRVDGGSFLPVEMFFASLALGGAVTSLFLLYLDSRSGSVLQRPEIAGLSSSDSDD